MVFKAIYDYIYGNQEKLKRQKYSRWYYENYEDMRKAVNVLLEGRDIPLDESRIKQLDPSPEWVDKEMVKKGQKFTQNYLYVVSIVEISSVYLLLLIESILRPLIFTNQSSTVKTAMKRYFSTALRVLSWHETDLFDENSEGRRNINTVNQIHISVFEQMKSKSDDEVREKSQLKNRLKEDLWSYGCPFIRKDLEHMKKRDSIDFDDDVYSMNYINQFTMALTQYAFMALLVLYPDKLGVNATEEELYSFIHLWRYIGYLLGIEDKYNICIGTFDQVIFKCQALTEMIFKPNLARITPEWEHMSHAVCEGMNIIIDDLVFESTVVNLLQLYDLDCNEYFKSISWWAKFKYYFYKFLTLLLPIKHVREFINLQVRSKIEAGKIKYNKESMEN